MFDTTMLFKISSLFIFPRIEREDAITYSNAENLLSLQFVRLIRGVKSGVVG